MSEILFRVTHWFGTIRASYWRARRRLVSTRGRTRLSSIGSARSPPRRGHIKRWMIDSVLRSGWLRVGVVECMGAGWNKLSSVRCTHRGGQSWAVHQAAIGRQAIGLDGVVADHILSTWKASLTDNCLGRMTAGGDNGSGRWHSIRWSVKDKVWSKHSVHWFTCWNMTRESRAYEETFPQLWRWKGTESSRDGIRSNASWLLLSHCRRSVCSTDGPL